MKKLDTDWIVKSSAKAAADKEDNVPTGGGPLSRKAKTLEDIVRQVLDYAEEHCREVGHYSHQNDCPASDSAFEKCICGFDDLRNYFERFL